MMKKRCLPLLLALCCLILPAQAAGFYDVPQDHWAAPEIQAAVDAGVVTGYGDGSFQPRRDVTAAQFCAMLCRSFLSEEYAAAPEGKYQAMKACLPVLEGTEVAFRYQALGNRWDRYVDEPLTRYDMAQTIYNVLLKMDALHETITLSTGEIADWTEIPEGLHSAVFTCWGLGLLQGQSDGRFAGEDHLNRAQAAVVWYRLRDFLGLAPEEAPDPNAGLTPLEMPAFALGEDETVQEMMRRVNAGTPRCKEGFLPNGMPRTEENIQALLELVKQGCPDGTVWSGTMRFDYKSRLGPTKGPMSFAMAATDFIFGEEAPVVTLRTFRALSVGDVLHIRGGDAERVLILTSVDYENDNYTACQLELNGKVDWGEWGPISGLVDSPRFTTAYRRWEYT